MTSFAPHRDPHHPNRDPRQHCPPRALHHGASEQLHHPLPELGRPKQLGPVTTAGGGEGPMAGGGAKGAVDLGLGGGRGDPPGDERGGGGEGAVEVGSGGGELVGEDVIKGVLGEGEAVGVGRVAG
ncbi:glycine-rich protein 5-like [Eucalyptus grandis]|uniref:glycine-rich protein 5-like n=1 Tax=Eucalyptus grandis TaxID=71139 RepID=UPI00192F05F2|nr:glycine-rich protein 5-like [Eucalyptus grandis]